MTISVSGFMFQTKVSWRQCFLAVGTILSFIVCCSCDRITNLWFNIWFSVSPQSFCDCSNFMWMFRFDQIIGNYFSYTRTEDVCRCFSKVWWLRGSPWGFIQFWAWLTVSALDLLWHTPALTHITYIQQDPQPCTAGPWAILMRWPTGVFL